jgi:transposase
MSRDELIALVGRKDAQIARQAAEMSALLERAETVEARLAKLEYLLSRNSRNSSSSPSHDDDLGKTSPEGGPGSPSGQGKRRRGKQKGAPGANLAWSDHPDEFTPRFPEGACRCGSDLSGASDLGVVDRYQQHEIPLVSVKVTQFEQHAVLCSCGTTHTAGRPEGAGKGPSGTAGYGPDLAAFAVFLLVVHHVPVRRCCQILESLTGAAPSPGFVHAMVKRTAAALGEADRRIRALITAAYVVCLDETPLKVGPKTPRPGKKQARRYLLVACTELYTHFLLGDRGLETFKASVLTDLTDSIIVHDRYQNYDSAKLGKFSHQLCAAHILRDLANAAEVYPGTIWPEQIADALRGMIHQANLARAAGLDAIGAQVKDALFHQFRHGVLVGLSQTTTRGTRPGEAKTRNLLEVLRDREDDVLRFAHDLKVPPTSNQAERDLRPSKLQEKISGRLTSEERTRNRYTIVGVVSTAAKHGRDKLATLRDALAGKPWMPELPTPV